jgi:hypothetical protein
MELKTLLNKISDGVKIIMAVPSIIFSDRENAKLVEENHVITKFEEARPDLVALKYYGTTEGLDIILKYNNISDPFSIKQGQIISVPSQEISLVKFKRPKEVEENPVKQQFIDTKRLTTKDQKRVKALQKKYGKENLLPPNVIPVGKKTYRFERGKIVFGKQAQSDPVVDQILKETRSQDTQNLS